MDLVSDRGRRVSVDELNTSRLLANARKQAHRRNLDDMLIVDVDAHHYENENFAEILPFMENEVLQAAVDLGAGQGRAPFADAGQSRLPGHGRPRDPLSAALRPRRPRRRTSTATSSSATAGWTR